MSEASAVTSPQQGGAQHVGSPFPPSGGDTMVRFWGVRGSIPSPGPETVYFGGNTSCVEIRADGELIILDAGTGIRGLGQRLKREFGDASIRATILITHTHWDHIQGFPFFAPGYDPQNRIRVLAPEGPRKSLEATLSIQMESPYFPISLQSMPGNIEFDELRSFDFAVGKVRVKAERMNHPGMCVGYRLYTSAGSVVYLTDNELVPHKPELEETAQSVFARKQRHGLKEFICGADIVISDAQYDAREYSEHVGWGHSCVDDVVELAMDSGVKRLFLFHHDPDHDDTRVTQMLDSARRQVAEKRGTLRVDAAREGVEVVLKAQT